LRNRQRRHWLEKAQPPQDDGADWPSELVPPPSGRAMPTARDAGATRPGGNDIPAALLL